MIQIGLAAFGLSALWMAMSNSPQSRRWAPIVGLAGQPFWVAFSVQSSAWGLLALSLAYSAVYAMGAYNQWATHKKGKQDV